MNDAVVTEDIGRSGNKKMNRPDALNSMNPWMFMGIRDALHDAQDDDTRCCGDYRRGSCVLCGPDLADSNSPDPDAPKESCVSLDAQSLNGISQAVDCCGQRIRRWRWDDDAVHCDLVLMAKSVKMRTFPQLGLAPEAGSSFSFAERMGWQNAPYALLSGRWFSAQECLDMGLAWRVEVDEEVLAKSMEVAEELAKKSDSLVNSHKGIDDDGWPSRGLVVGAW